MASSGQRNTHRSAKGRRAATQVDSNVEDFAGEGLDQFSLGVPDLVVQAAQHVSHRERRIVLDETSIQAGFLLEGSTVVALEKEAALVLVHARLEQQHVGKLGTRHFHESSRSVSTRRRYSP